MAKARISRRKFLQYSGASAAALMVQPWLPDQAGAAAPTLSSSGLSLPCCVGDVSADGAVMWLRTDGAKSAVIEYAKNANFQGASRTARLATRSDNDFTAKVAVGQLEPATEYFYRAAVGDLPPGPAARFVTAPRADAPASFRFAFSGDTRQNHQPFTIMDAIREKKPDFFLHLGDTIYGDREGVAHTLGQYHGKYVANRKDEPTQRLFAETSLMVVWDDHEVADNYRAAHPLAPIGRRAFMDFWPVRQDAGEPDRVYRNLRWGKSAEFFILDTRQYRDDDAGSILGAAQMAWLRDTLAQSEARFKFICTSVPISAPNRDKWGGFPAERDAFLRFIREKRISGVIFLSADVHYAAVTRVTNTALREVIAGPLGAPMGAGTGKEKRFEFFNNQFLNYAMVEVHEAGGQSYVEVELLTDKNVSLHKVRFGAGAKTDS